MISLIGPSPGAVRYFLYRSFILGPYGPQHQYLNDLASFEHRSEGMVEAPGIYGENYVLHGKASAELVYKPIYTNSSHDPSLGNPYLPDRVRMPAYLAGSQATDLIGNNGFAFEGSAAYQRNYVQYVGTTYYQWFITDESATQDCTITMWQIQGYATQPTGIWKYEIAGVKKWDATKAYFDVKVTSYSIPYNPTSFDLVSRRSPEDVIKYAMGYKVASVSTSEVNSMWYTARFVQEPIFSPTNVKRAVASIAEALEVQGNPLEPIHFGELAMRASEKVNANSVNMLAFLRDLRNPRAMLLKLSNLRDLKTHANNYLAVKYGVLPTIDDLSTIVEACRKIKPYLDKNGFETYNAASEQVKNDGKYHYTLDQHLKLAIDDEDNGLYALTQSVESLGFLPTFQNVWDLIPYSFIIDWFISVGDLLRRVDTNMRLTRLNVRYVTMSQKSTTTKVVDWANDFPYTGIIQFGCYNRWVTDHCPTPVTSLHTTFDGFDHWIEAGALLLQRNKKFKFN